MVYLTIIIIVLGSIGGTVFLWVTWYLKKKNLDEAKKKENPDELDSYLIEELGSQTKRYMFMAIGATIFTVSLMPVKTDEVNNNEKC